MILRPLGRACGCKPLSLTLRSRFRRARARPCLAHRVRGLPAVRPIARLPPDRGRFQSPRWRSRCSASTPLVAKTDREWPSSTAPQNVASRFEANVREWRESKSDSWADRHKWARGALSRPDRGAAQSRQHRLSGRGMTPHEMSKRYQRVAQRRMADRAGFEPAIRFPVYTLSRRAPSTTRPPVRRAAYDLGARFFQGPLPAE